MMQTEASITPVAENVQSIWGLPLQPAGCAHCGGTFLIESRQMGMRCPNCAQGELAPQPALLRPEPPEKIVPFMKTTTDLEQILSTFVKGVWLRPPDFNADALLQRAVPMYWPMWLVDSNTSGNWQADMGFDYQVKSSQSSYAGNRWQTREVLEDRIRWEPRMGQIKRHYDNSTAPALSEHIVLQQRMGSYTTQQARNYDTSLLQHSALRVPDLQPEQSWPLVRPQIEQRAAEDCRKASGGQHIRDFSGNLQHQDLNWTQLLLPMYFTYYQDEHNNVHPIYINGQSGTAGGLRLASQREGWKWAGITAAVAAGILLIALLCFVLSRALSQAAVAGTLLAILALFVGAGAIVPAVWPWQWNRKQQDQKVREYD
jgi:hypothetical protein